MHDEQRAGEIEELQEGRVIPKQEEVGDSAKQPCSDYGVAEVQHLLFFVDHVQGQSVPVAEVFGVEQPGELLLLDLQLQDFLFLGLAGHGLVRWIL